MTTKATAPVPIKDPPPPKLPEQIPAEARREILRQHFFTPENQDPDARDRFFRGGGTPQTTTAAGGLPDYGANDPTRPDVLPPVEFDGAKYGAQIRALQKAAGVGSETGSGGAGGGGTGGGGGGGGAGSGSGSGGAGGGTPRGGAAGKIDAAMAALQELANDTVAGGEERNADVRAAAEAALIDALENAEILKLDPKYAQQAQELRDKLEASRGRLTDLSPEDQEKFRQMAEAEQALLEQQFAEGQDNLITAMFGSGREQSTFAMNEGGRLLGQQGLVMQQQQAAANARELSMRQFLTQEGRANLMGQASILESDRQGELQSLDLQARQHAANADRAAGTFGQLETLQTQREMGALQSATQATTAKIGATASMENARVAAAAQRAAAAAQASATRAAAASAASASRFAAMKRLEGLKYSTNAQTALQLRGQDIQQSQFGQSLSQQQYETDLGATVRREGMQTDYAIADMTSDRSLQGAKYGADMQNRMNKRNSLFGAVGGLLGAAGAAGGFGMLFSDATIKHEIHAIHGLAELVDSLEVKGYEFDRGWGPEGDRVGFIAQEVAKVLPQAVNEDMEGKLHLDPLALVGVLVQAVQDLRQRLADLEMEVV